MNEGDRQTFHEGDFRCGYAALIGEPNVGKSTLLNAILGTKLSIVTAKPQTTRRQIPGFHNDPSTQIIFIDTPGLIDPKYVLQRAMVQTAISAMQSADCIVLMLDAKKIARRDELLPEGLPAFLRDAGVDTLGVLNKSDLVQNKNELLPLIGKLHALKFFKEILPISALASEGVRELLAAIRKCLPVQPPLYPPDLLTDQPERFFVTEIIREKIFERFRQEVPYATEVVIAEFRDEEKRSYIAADILVERETQRRILIGHRGSAIKEVGIAARKDIEALLDRPVFLELHVKVRQGWRDSEDWIRRLGYNART